MSLAVDEARPDCADVVEDVVVDAGDVSAAAKAAAGKIMAKKDFMMTGGVLV